MKRFSQYVVLALAGFICLGFTEASAQKAAKNTEIGWTADDVKWEALAGAPPGVMGANLWGDQARGAYGGLTKFPAGFKSPLHSHTFATRIVVIKGAYTLNGKAYGPGSYVFVPAGMKHESGGVADSETIFFIEQSGKFDVVMAKPPMEKK
jgi:quercetin dioxygenase-like cupin family protein